MSGQSQPSIGTRWHWRSVIGGLAVLGAGLACGKSDKATGPTGPLHDIVVSPSSATVAVGGGQGFTAIGRDAAGRTVSGLTFFWSSSRDSVASVTQGGQVTAVDTGQVRIAASVQGVSGFSTLTVSAKPVGLILITPSSATLRPATTLQLTDTVKDASGHPISGQSVTWQSDSPTIVSVDADGLVTARVLGTAHITASAGGKSAQATIAVSQIPVASIVISPSAPSVFVGQTTQLTAITKDASGNVLPGRVVRWSSQTAAAATIDSIAGVLTGAGVGTSLITAKSEGVTSTVTATVSNAPANSVVVSPNISQVNVGATVSLSAVVTNSLGQPVTNPTVTFTSNKPTVASVSSQSGATAQILAGPTAGTATITGTSGTATGTATIIVSLAGVDSVSIGALRDTLTPGQMETLTATPFDSSGNPLTGRPVTWQSSNTGVATVTGVGLVTGQGTGVAVIRATISGVQGFLTIVVNPVPVGSVTITPNTDTIQVVGQLQLTATVRDPGGNIINRPGTWYSRNNGIAVVTSSGLVTGVGVGTTSIIDSVGGKADTNTTVVLVPVTSVVVYPTPDTIYATSPLNTVQLQDSTKDAGGHNLGRSVTWTPTSGGVATVNAAGLVTATNSSTGTATITATGVGGSMPSGSASVVVIGHAQSLSIANFDAAHPDSLSVNGATADGSDPTSATILDTFGNNISSGRVVTWTSSDATALLINGAASATVVGAVTLTPMSNGFLPEAVTLTATTTDPHTSSTVTNTLVVTVIP